MNTIPPYTTKPLGGFCVLRTQWRSCFGFFRHDSLLIGVGCGAVNPRSAHEFRNRTGWHQRKKLPICRPLRSRPQIVSRDLSDKALSQSLWSGQPTPISSEQMNAKAVTGPHTKARKATSGFFTGIKSGFPTVLRLDVAEGTTTTQFPMYNEFMKVYGSLINSGLTRPS